MRTRTASITPPLALAGALLCAAAARADAPAGAVALDLKDVSLTYTVVHKLHEVKATCKTAEGRAAVVPNGPVKVQVRAKVACFDSGDSNRDVHMREVTHEPLHPFVTVKGTLDGLAFPLAAAVEKTLAARVELAGETQAASIPITLTPDGAKVRGRFKVALSLDGFKIERPSLLLVKVEDALLIEGELTFEAAAP